MIFVGFLPLSVNQAQFHVDINSLYFIYLQYIYVHSSSSVLIYFGYNHTLWRIFHKHQTYRGLTVKNQPILGQLFNPPIFLPFSKTPTELFITEPKGDPLNVENIK